MNPCDRYTERAAWLRWEISNELACSIAPGLRDGSQAARDTLVRWLVEDRARLVSHCLGAINSCARSEGIEPFTRAEIDHEISRVAWCHKVGR